MTKSTRTKKTKKGRTACVAGRGWFILSGRGISVGCRPLDGPPPINGWITVYNTLEGIRGTFDADAPFELCVHAEGADNGRWGCPVDQGGPAIWKSADLFAAGAVLRDDGPLFRSVPSSERFLFAAMEEVLAIWSTRLPDRSTAVVIDGPFDPARLVLPFATFVDASGRTRRLLLPRRARYGGRSARFDFKQRLGYSGKPGDDPQPVFWTDGPGGPRPYRGPWSERP